MWYRFALFAFCCAIAVDSIYQADETLNRGRNVGSQLSQVSESNFGREGQFGNDKVSTGTTYQENQGSRNGGTSSSNSQRNHGHQEINSSNYNTNEGVSFGQPVKNSNTVSRPNYEEEHLSGRPSVQTNNRENNYQTPEFSSNHREQSSRPSGSLTSGSTGSDEYRPTRPNYEEQPLGSFGQNRPGTGNRPSSSRPEQTSFNSQSSEVRPNNEREHLSNRPTEGSSHMTGHSQGGIRPSESRPGNVGDHSFGRPGESSPVASHNQGNGRPNSFQPSNENGQFGRPTESYHGQQSGSRPTEQGGHSEHLPTGSEPNQFVTSGTNEESQGTGNVTDEGKEDDKDVCFPNLGCFKMGKPWKSILRPIGAPHSPEKIQTTIHFYSRENMEKQKNITVYPRINMGEARFDPRKITAMIVHGFSNSGNATWMKDMKNVYLQKVDANVMIVDWGKGAQLLNYLQVAGNTRVVGKQLGLFVKHLKENYGADPGKFHLIGHSLGAQICSYLAKEVPGIARLTALDPAQPGFEGFDAELRLDKTDAEFVDVIHTDARPFIPTLGFGMITPHGHVDFYMNGGFDQPGCVPPSKKELPSVKGLLDFAKYPVEVIAKSVACPHARAYEYLIEAFNETEKCIFWGHKADVKNVFKSVTNTVTQGLLKKFTALSTTCSKEDCIPLGFATKKSPLRGIFVVTTGSRSPYCISEPGVPPETLPQERKEESFIQKIGRKTGLSG